MRRSTVLQLVFRPHPQTLDSSRRGSTVVERPTTDGEVKGLNLASRRSEPGEKSRSVQAQKSFVTVEEHVLETNARKQQSKAATVV